MEGLRNLILGIEMLPLIWACTLCVMHPSCFFGSFNQSFLLRAAFHQTSNDVVLFDHVPAFTSVALACHQCTSGLWMTSSHWADCSGLILRRGVGFLCWMCSCSLFTHLWMRWSLTSDPIHVEVCLWADLMIIHSGAPLSGLLCLNYFLNIWQYLWVLMSNGFFFFCSSANLIL